MTNQRVGLGRRVCDVVGDDRSRVVVGPAREGLLDDALGRRRGIGRPAHRHSEGFGSQHRVHAVAAEEQRIAGQQVHLVDLGIAVAEAQRPLDAVAVGMDLRLLLGDDATAEHPAHTRVVLGELDGHAIAHQIRTTVTNMADPRMGRAQEGSHKGGTHTRAAAIGRLRDDGLVGVARDLHQGGCRIEVDAIALSHLEQLLDVALRAGDRKATGHVATLVSAHPVGHHGKGGYVTGEPMDIGEVEDIEAVLVRLARPRCTVATKNHRLVPPIAFVPLAFADPLRMVRATTMPMAATSATPAPITR